MPKVRQHFFVTESEPLRSNWVAAFPDARLEHWSDLRLGFGDALFWLVLPYEEGAIPPLLRKWRKLAGQTPLVALSDEPRDEEGLAVLRAGVSGYCNGYASPAVLTQVAATVEEGGVWVGQSLMQQLVNVLVTHAARPPGQPGPWAAILTEREQAVAMAVASGASNKEIADRLGITERTVKAHLSAAFEKLQVRDRLQLTLLVNGLSSPPPA